MSSILIVEDDPLHLVAIEKTLASEFGGPMKTRRFRTESEFYHGFENIASEVWSLAIIDLKIRWATPAPDMPQPPDEVMSGGHMYAGLRCRERLRSDYRTADVPVILYSSYPDLLPNDKVLPKQFDMGPLIEEIKRLLARRNVRRIR
jgi:CheY-like chemotaxis protein